jgi:hypothetical protein
MPGYSGAERDSNYDVTWEVEGHHSSQMLTFCKHSAVILTSSKHTMVASRKQQGMLIPASVRCSITKLTKSK